MNSDSQAFLDRISSQFGFSDTVNQQVVRFRELLLAENAVQNLTRLTAIEDFIDGHLVDCVELLKSGLVNYPALDLGSGGGVPGLLAAVLGSGPWILSDSETSKAAFLERAASALELEDVCEVYPGRAETYLKSRQAASVVARAVGKIEKIFGWVENCSTWNNIVLLKGPGWEEEWSEFLKSRHRRRLKVIGEHRYQVGPEAKKRVIVRIERA